MSRIFAVFLALHGLAHLVGFLVPWRLMESDEMPYTTTLLNGTVDVGAVGIRVAGLGWLALGLAFGWSAWGVWSGQGWAGGSVAAVATASAIMCIVGWPQARIGLYVDLAILAALVAASRIDALHLAG